MKRIAIIVLLVLAAAVGGCAVGGKSSVSSTTNTPQNNGEKMPLPESHSISKADGVLILKHTKENLKIIMSVKDETAALSKALGGTALKQMSEQIAQGLAENRIKERRYDDVQLKIKTDTKSMVGVVLTFTDNSRLLDLRTGTQIEGPSGKKITLLLAVDKVKKRWIIKEIFSKDLQPKPSET